MAWSSARNGEAGEQVSGLKEGPDEFGVDSKKVLMIMDYCNNSSGRRDSPLCGVRLGGTTLAPTVSGKADHR
jgi:hypothetical protein